MTFNQHTNGRVNFSFVRVINICGETVSSGEEVVSNFCFCSDHEEFLRKAMRVVAKTPQDKVTCRDKSLTRQIVKVGGCGSYKLVIIAVQY